MIGFNAAASAQQASYAASFSPGSVYVGESSTLMLSMSNEGNSTTELGMEAFFPAGLTGTGDVLAICAGTENSSPGNTNVLPAFDTLAPGASCSFSQQVKATAPGVYVVLVSYGLNGLSALTLQVTGGAPAAAYQIGIASPPVAGSQVTGTASSVDAYGNAVTNFNGSAQVTSSDPAAVCSGVVLTNGAGPFTCVFKTAGVQTVTVKDAAGFAGTDTFTVVAAPASTYTVSTGPLAVAGSAASGSLQVVDPFGNSASTYSGAAQITSGDPAAVCSTSQIAKGKGSFTCTFGTLGMQTLQVKDAAGLLTAAQTSVTVIATPLLTVSPTLIVLDDFTLATLRTAQLTSTAPGVSFSAVSDSAWAQVTPSATTTNATLQVRGIDNGLAAGTYQGMIQITAPAAANSPQVIPVLFTVGPGSPGQTDVISAASLALTTTAPNSILALFAPALACDQPPVVLVNGASASILYAGASQINFVVPGNISGATATIQAECDGATLASVTTALAQVTPALFTQTQSGTGQASVINSDGTVNTADNPAQRGSWVSVYVTGFGVLNPAGADGLQRLAAPVTATIGGEPADVLYAGEAPGLASGVQQINISVPTDAPAGGAVPITVTSNGVAAQGGTTIALQ